MPGIAAATAMALAAMTESPMAVICLPVTLPGVAVGAGVPVALGVLEPDAPGPRVLVPGERAGDEACAWVAALTCSPSLICFSIPAGAAAWCSSPHPPVA